MHHLSSYGLSDKGDRHHKKRYKGRNSSVGKSGSLERIQEVQVVENEYDGTAADIQRNRREANQKRNRRLKRNKSGCHVRKISGGEFENKIEVNQQQHDESI